MGADSRKLWWCVKVDSRLNDEGEIYLEADQVRAADCGALECIRVDPDGAEQVTLLLPAGMWWGVSAAMMHDVGSFTLSAEHWYI